VTPREGLASARAKGRLLGRPKGVLGKSRLILPAEELNRLVVTEIALDGVANRHSVPDYPHDARFSRIQGEVRFLIKDEHGKMVNVTAEFGSPMLADYSARWVRWHWQFRPTVTGVYFLPVFI
jgi:hypothetical protein